MQMVSNGIESARCSKSETARSSNSVESLLHIPQQPTLSCHPDINGFTSGAQDFRNSVAETFSSTKMTMNLLQANINSIMSLIQQQTWLFSQLYIGISSQERTLQGYFDTNVSRLEKRCTATQADPGMIRGSKVDEKILVTKEQVLQKRLSELSVSEQHSEMTNPAELQTPCSIIQPSQEVRDTHTLRKTDKTEPDSFTTLWVGGFQSKRKSTQILRSELSKLLDADASSSKRLTHGSFKVQVLTSDAPRMLRLNGLAHKDFPSGIKIERYAPLPGKQVKLTGDTAEHGETSAPTPASDDPNGSVSKREGSDEDRSGERAGMKS